MDGGAFDQTSWATAVIAEYEGFFVHEQRCDGKVSVDGLNEFNSAAFEKDGEILVLLMNMTPDAITVRAIIGGRTHTVEIGAYGNEVLITNAR